MNDVSQAAGKIDLQDLREWYDAAELNLLLEAQAPDETMYWKVTATEEWEELESTAQIADILHLVSQEGDTFNFEGEEPINKYAQGLRLADGNFMLELAIVDSHAYNMRIAYGPKADSASSSPDDDVEPYGPQSLTVAQVHEVLTGWVLGRGLPDGYGGSIHMYR